MTPSRNRRCAGIGTSAFRFRPSAFTLVELLVVITIISMLMGLLLPAVQSAREAGRRATCLNGEKQLAMAALNYESSRRSFPGFANWIGQNKTIPASWVVTLFPYVEKKDMYDLWASNVTWSSSPGTATGAITGVNPYMKMLVCPSDSSDNQTDAWCSYVCNRGCNGWNLPCLGVCLDQATPTTTPATPPFVVTLDYITAHDGSSTTLLLAESLLANPPTGNQLLIPRVDNSATGTPKPSWAKWTTPPAMATTTALTNATNVLTAATSAIYGTSAATNDMEAAMGFEWSQWSTSPKLADKLLSRHPGGVVASFCDGHQQFIADSIETDTYKMLMTPYGNGVPRDTTDTTMLNGSPWSGQTACKSPTGIVPLPTYLLDESKY